VLLAIGRMHVAAFAAQPQHHYLLRFVDPATASVTLPDHHVIVDRGPFTMAGDRLLLEEHRIEVVIAKNAGGRGAEAKLTAARALSRPVIMIDRPALPERIEVYNTDDVLHWLDHGATASTERGV
jgi:precorrin-6A/cobalt-precorrin-6A reductase